MLGSSDFFGLKNIIFAGKQSKTSLLFSSPSSLALTGSFVSLPSNLETRFSAAGLPGAELTGLNPFRGRFFEAEGVIEDISVCIQPSWSPEFRGGRVEICVGVTSLTQLV